MGPAAGGSRGGGVVRLPKVFGQTFRSACELGFNGRNGSLEAIHTKLFSQELELAHRAGGGVKGLVKIVQHSEGMRVCLCEKNAGVTLGAWVTYNTQLIERKCMKATAELERAMSPAPGPTSGGDGGDFGWRRGLKHHFFAIFAKGQKK